MADATKLLRELLFATLRDDSGVQAAASGGVYATRAPEGTARPYVVFFQQSGAPRYTFARPSTKDFLFVVKGVTEGDDDGPACDLDAAIEAALTDQLDGRVLVGAGVVTLCRREADVDYPETDTPGVYLTHKGGSYRIRVAF